MTVVQCNRCKKIIKKGYGVRFEYRSFVLNEKERTQDYKKLVERELDYCNDCFLELGTFLSPKENRK